MRLSPYSTLNVIKDHYVKSGIYILFVDVCTFPTSFTIYSYFKTESSANKVIKKRHTVTSSKMLDFTGNCGLHIKIAHKSSRLFTCQLSYVCLKNEISLIYDSFDTGFGLHCPATRNCENFNIHSKSCISYWVQGDQKHPVNNNLTLTSKSCALSLDLASDTENITNFIPPTVFSTSSKVLAVNKDISNELSWQPMSLSLLMPDREGQFDLRRGSMAAYLIQLDHQYTSGNKVFRLMVKLSLFIITII